MKEVRIQLDYQTGPIYKNVEKEDGTLGTGIPVVDEDRILRMLDSKAKKLYSSLYSFDDENNEYHFDEEGFIEKSPELRGIMYMIKRRLEVINDGSFIVVDEEDERLEKARAREKKQLEEDPEYKRICEHEKELEEMLKAERQKAENRKLAESTDAQDTHRTPDYFRGQLDFGTWLQIVNVQYKSSLNHGFRRKR